MTCRAKIVCTLGPATSSEESIAALLDAGMNVARMNFSHGDHADHKATYDRLRIAAKSADEALAIMADLQGPAYQQVPSVQLLMSQRNFAARHSRP